MARKAKLPNKKAIARIKSYILGGAFPHIAAGAEGIAPSTFFRWMQMGKQGIKPYQAFWEEVTKAQSQKRLAAEVQVAKENPLAWLRLGPGRTRPGEPGWTADPVVLPGDDGRDSDSEGLTDEERAESIAALLERARTRATRPAADAGAADGNVGA
jgi:hypothetical protein